MGNYRTSVFETIKNNKRYSKALKNTKMCHNIYRYGRCDRMRCMFAHSEDELCFVNCIFGNNCRFQDTKTRKCPFLHPNESSYTFYKRTGCKSTHEMKNKMIDIELVL